MCPTWQKLLPQQLWFQTPLRSLNLMSLSKKRCHGIACRCVICLAMGRFAIHVIKAKLNASKFRWLQGELFVEATAQHGWSGATPHVPAQVEPAWDCTLDTDVLGATSLNLYSTRNSVDTSIGAIDVNLQDFTIGIARWVDLLDAGLVIGQLLLQAIKPAEDIKNIRAPMRYIATPNPTENFLRACVACFLFVL